MKNFQLILKLTGIATGFTLLFSTISVSANDLQETLQEQQNEASTLETQIEDIHSQISQLEEEIAATESAINEKMSQIFAIMDQMDLLQAEIYDLEQEILQTEGEIEERQAEIAELEESQKRRLDILRERATALQQQNRMNIVVDVILKSESIVDLIHRVTSVGILFQSDTEIMQELQDTQVIIEEEKATLEEEKERLTEKETELTNKQNQLEEQRQAIESQQATIEEEQANLLTMQEEKNQSLNDLEYSLSQVREDISETNAQIAEAERLLAEQRAAQERAEQERLAQEQAQGGGVAGGSTGQPSQFNGRFALPVSGNWHVSSPFGMRTHPVLGIRSFHRGIDIVSSQANAPIFAIADGTVVFSGWAGSLGNYVVIQHDATTFSGYAHNSKNMVQVGQQVSVGQQVAVMGTTGRSSGVHLHLEIMLNTTNFWNGHVDPAPLLGL